MITSKEKTPSFLIGGGEMGELMRSKDWSNFPLGTPENWPQNLRTVINLLLNSKFPMFVWWGKELYTFYNDPYQLIAGEKHPELLGKRGNIAWAEIWDELSPLVDNVFQGKATWSEDQILNINRHGYIEESYFTFSYSPVFEDDGSVAGLFCVCIENTEKVFAAKKIKESEKNLRNTIIQSPVAMCILKGKDFTVEIANARMYELWGRGEEEMANKPIFEALPEAREQGLEDLLLHVFNTGETFYADEMAVTLPKNGKDETMFLNFVYEPFREVDGTITGIIAVAIEATLQVLARKKIEESENELQVRVKERTEELVKQNLLVENILKNSVNGISVTEMLRDENGLIVDARTILANDAAVNNTGLSREDFLSLTALQLDPNMLSSPYGQACIKTLETGEPFVLQYLLELTGRWLELSVSKMDDDHLIHIFTDVTQIKEAQIFLERTVEELSRSNANLEQFAYAASHDLKEPVRKITLFAERLKSEFEGVLSESQARLFDRIRNATKRMTVLIDDLLEYSHVTSGALNVESLNLNAKVEMVLEDLELQLQEKQAKITVDPLPTITGNRRQIQQLFQNLVSNAVKYSKEGVIPEVTITSTVVKGKDTKAKLGARESNIDYYKIEIKDNGIGFDEKYSEDIFKIFTRLHGLAEYKGSGVGLSIVRRVVENHHGFIWAESTPGEGSTFTVLLPVS